MVVLPSAVEQLVAAIYPPAKQSAALRLAFDLNWLFWIGAFFQIALLLCLWRACRRWLPPAQSLPPLCRVLAASACAGVSAVAVAIALLPLTWYGGFTLLHEYGLSRQTPASWLRDWAVAAVMSALIFAVLGAMFAAALHAWPKRWPLAAAFAAAPLIVFANAIYPVYIAPLFNAYKPLPASRLSASILRLAAAQGIGASVVYVYDMSRQTTGDNAYVAGIGKTERIAIGDNLLRHLRPDEVLYVVAHEIGHYKLRHLWWGTLYAWLDALGAIAVLALSAKLLRTRAGSLGDAAQLPLVGALLVSYAVLSMPLVNSLSRRMEADADKFAAARAPAREAGVRALARLGNDGLTPLHPGPWTVWYFYTHPPLDARIAAAAGAQR
jgi:STE24 endopeptidase